MRPWGLLVSAAGCSGGAVLADGSLRNTLIGLAGVQATATFGYLIDRTIHPRDWFRRKRKIDGGHSYQSFPYKRYLRWLATADRVVIIDTVPHLLADAYRKQFLEALRGALSRGARVDIAVYCPCSKELEGRAGQLDLTVPQLRDRAEAALSTLDRFRAALTASDRRRLGLWLHSTPLHYVDYRCDNRVLRSYLEGRESQTCEHKVYLATSPEGQSCEEALADITARRGARTFFDSHMRGILKVGDKRFGGIPHIIDYTQAEHITFIAAPKEALEAMAGNPAEVSWHQGVTRITGCELKLCTGDYFLRWASPRFRDRYGTGTVPALYRVTSCSTEKAPVPSP